MKMKQMMQTFDEILGGLSFSGFRAFRKRSTLVIVYTTWTGSFQGALLFFLAFINFFCFGVIYFTIVYMKFLLVIQIWRLLNCSLP